MIIKNYGNSSENIYEYADVNGNSTNTFFKKIHKKGLELLKYDDILSANSLNRSIQNLYEDEKNNYRAFQSFSKFVLQDKSNCFIDGELEGFGKEKLKIILSPFNNRKKYLRIPTGILIVNQEDNALNDENISIYVNSPNVSLFEREIANHFGIDLNEGKNFVNIDYKVIDSNLYYSYEITTLKKEIEIQNVNGDEIYIPKISEKTIDEKERDDNGNIIQVEQIENVIQLVSSINSKLVRNYKKRDEYYSLEEIIPLPESIDKKYIYVFFNSNIGKENKEYYKENTTYYSHSGKFCLHLSNQEDLNEVSDENLKKYGIPIYRLTTSNLPTTFNSLSAVVNQNSTLSYLQIADRNFSEFRKLDVNYKTRLFNSIELLDNIELKNDTSKPNIIKVTELKDSNNNTKDVTLELDTKIINNDNITNNGITTINNTLKVRKDENNIYDWVLADDVALNILV